MQSEPLVLPLLLTDKAPVSVFIEQACSSSPSTQLLSWGLDGAEQESSPALSGAALGCEDGSVYLFSADVANSDASTGNIDLTSRKHAASLHVALATQVPSAPSPSPSTSSSLKSPPRSRRTSHTLHSPHPLSQPTRSHVTSSVSKTSAEAPKNYVDFDDEKERLEDMIKGGPPLKEKSLADALRPSYGVAGLGFGKDDSRSLGGNRQSKRFSFPRGSPSTSGTPRDSLSSPPSPSSPFFAQPPGQTSSTNLGGAAHVGVAPRLVLRSHVFPPRFGVGHGVSILRRLSSDILLCLQETGNLSVISIRSGLCLASLDLESSPHLHAPPSPAPSIFTGTTVDHAVWAWKFLRTAETPEAMVLLATASDQASADKEDVESRTRVAILQLQKTDPLQSSLESGMARHGVLQKVGEWIVPGTPETIGLLEDDTMSNPTFFYVIPGPSPKLVSHSLQVVPPAFVIAAPTSLQPSPDALSSTSSVSANPTTSTSLPNLPLSIPNPFKPKSAGVEENKLETDTVAAPGRVVLGPAVALGLIPPLEGNNPLNGIQIWNAGDGTVRGVLWDDTNFGVFETRDSENSSRSLASASHRGLTHVERLGRDIFVLFQKRRIDTYRVPALHGLSASFLEHISSRTFTQPCHPSTAISPSLLLCSRPKQNSDGSIRHRLAYTPVTQIGHKVTNDLKDETKPWSAWSPSAEKRPAQRERRVTSLLPLELELIVLGYSDGSIGRSSLSDLLIMGWPAPRENNLGINGLITSLHTIKDQRSGERLIFGGVDDGGIAVWDLPTLQLRARWTIFTEPLRSVIYLEDEGVGRLQGCILCVSGDGTLAVIAVDGLEFLHLIPGSAARLTRICLGEDNLLLMYADGRARLWDIRTQEFWRSMTSKVADELLRQGGWFQADVDNDKRELNSTPLASIQKSFSSFDSASAILLDMRALNDLIHPLPASQLFRDPRREDSGSRPRDQAPVDASASSKRASRRLKFLKALLGSLLSFGLDDATDEICREKLKIMPSLSAVGLYSNESAAASLTTATSRKVWQASPEHTASRLLALVTVLRGLLAYDECEQYASQVIAFYVASLHESVGPLWQAPSLSYLARYWFHHSSEIRLAARALFGAAADRLSDDETIRLVEYWQHELPCLQPDAEKQSSYSALALLISGNIAAERYTVLAGSTLTDIAKSITLYLHDEACPHRTLAIDLCSRGFQIWQHHVDAMEVLRDLFSLATSAEKERNVGPQARLAVLQIASSNTPLFMSTLSLDILHPRSVLQQKSIMQLVAFLIRKKPLVLFPNLPRLVEAVVKSLDPSSSGDREAVFDAATEILGQVVKTFPSVDFHMQTQRLCVGTNEGAVIMYDLKTATRLYVLEGHKKRLASCSFSPDGRRLATVSLEESLVRVWKVGSSITSIFMPGAPPRQGHAGSEPFKTLNFNVGDEAHMTVAATLELVRFEWPGDRTARLKIRDSAFTFNT